MSKVLVTGASGGIGAAISRELARRGCSVVLHYQSDRAGARAALETLRGAGHSIVQADLGDTAGVEKLWREASSGAPLDAS